MRLVSFTFYRGFSVLGQLVLPRVFSRVRVRYLGAGLQGTALLPRLFFLFVPAAGLPPCWISASRLPVCGPAGCLLPPFSSYGGGVSLSLLLLGPVSSVLRRTKVLRAECSMLCVGSMYFPPWIFCKYVILPSFRDAYVPPASTAAG